MLLAVLVPAGLLAYGNLLAFRAVRAPIVVALNLALAAGLVLMARSAGASWHALGLDPRGVGSGLIQGAIVAGVVLASGFLVLLTPLRRPFRDLRAVEMRPSQLAFHYLLRIPFGTALAEEVFFRGVLLTLAAAEGWGLGALVWSSAAFGLWHVGATLDFLRANRPSADGPEKALAVLAGVAFTTVGGILFAVLRITAESLLAPILAHAAVNTVGFTLARSEPRAHASRPARG